MRFWDSSAIVPLLVPEAASERIVAVLDEDPEMLVWWATPVECTSALSRRERAGALAAAGVREAADRLRKLAHAWQEVAPAEAIRTTAQRLLRVHALRAGDALQLAAAIAAAEQDAQSLAFVCLDERLADAAAREGFPVVGA